MTVTTITQSTRIFAQPLGGGKWRVCATRSQKDDGATVGYIDELGGTYEVRVLNLPTVASYVDTFKDAMEFFTIREEVA